MTHTTVKNYEWSEWVATADRSIKAGNTGGIHGGDSWAGCSPKQALEMASVTGYTADLTEVEGMAAAISTNVFANTMLDTFQASWDVAGSEVDIARFMSGVPESMVESQPLRIASAGRAVRIAIPICYSCSVSKEQILRRGAAVVALAYVLQQAKHPLEIWAGYATYDRHGKDRVALMARVQRADEPFDAGRVMYALAHPSMLRRLGFAVADTQPEEIRDQFGFNAGGGYGKGAYGFALQESDLDETVGTTIIVPDNDRGMTWTTEQSVAWIEEQLASIFGDES